MIFHRSRIKCECVPITIRNENINETNSIKILGIIFDNKLKWHEHIIYIKNIVSRAIGIIYKARKYANKQTVKQMYYTLVFPYLIYCWEIWGNTSHTFFFFFFGKMIFIVCEQKNRQKNTNIFRSTN